MVPDITSFYHDYDLICAAASYTGKDPSTIPPNDIVTFPLGEK
jgi:hypothetical protein